MPPLAQPPTHSHFTCLKTPRPAPDFAQLCPGLWVWHAYEPAIKTDLFSTALATSSGIFLVDPIPVTEPDLASIIGTSSMAGVIVTNANHQRAALDYSNRFAVPVFGHPEALATIQPARPGDLSTITVESIEISGAVTGEITLYQPSTGTLIVGDALINLDAHGFTFLPSKYCLDQKQMRRSLRKLLSLPVERILFAHGTPIVARTSERLRTLIELS